MVLRRKARTCTQNMYVLQGIPPNKAHLIFVRDSDPVKSSFLFLSDIFHTFISQFQ